jgi:surface protein
VTNATDFRFMFYGCRSFNSDLSRWNVANATDLVGMFFNCRSFNSDLSSWNVANATSLVGMFAGCVSFDRTFVAAWPLPNQQIFEQLFTEPLGW